MRIDAHHHIWELSRRPHGWLDPPHMAALRRDFTIGELAPQAAAARIDATVLVQVLPDVAETAEFLATAAGSDLVGGVVGWVDLTATDLPHVLAGLRAGPGGHGLVGVRHLVQAEPDAEWLNRPDVRRGLRVVAAARLAYDLLVLPHQLPAAIATARALPELTFVLDHLAKPPIAGGELEPWASRIRMLARQPNVFAKLSGMVTEAGPQWTVEGLRPYAEELLDAFGPGRVMFGSDWPVCLLAAGYGEVCRAAERLTAGLSPDERDDVFGDTAIRAYGLVTNRFD
jgi:L-fuconolactonase